MPTDQVKDGQLIVASRKGQNIEIEKAEGIKSLIVLLNDSMLDLDQPVTISMNGTVLFKGMVPRTIEELHSTLAGRGDPGLMFDARVAVRIEEKGK